MNENTTNEYLNESIPTVNVSIITSIILLIISLSLNLTLILIFKKNKDLLKFENKLVFFLNILNLIGTIIEISILTISIFNFK